MTAGNKNYHLGLRSELLITKQLIQGCCVYLELRYLDISYHYPAANVRNMNFQTSQHSITIWFYILNLGLYIKTSTYCQYTLHAGVGAQSEAMEPAGARQHVISVQSIKYAAYKYHFMVLHVSGKKGQEIVRHKRKPERADEKFPSKC